MNDSLYLEIIQTFVTLSRSGRFLKKEALFDEMKLIFPELTMEEIKTICRPAVQAMYNAL